MPAINAIHIAIEIWGIIFCVIACICILSGAKSEPKSSHTLAELLMCNALILSGDALAWFFRGNPTTLGYYMVRISNFCVFLLNYVLLWVTVCYLENILSEKGVKFDKRLAFAARAVSVIGMSGIIISQFNHMYYYFDAGNYYHRSALYPMTQVLGIAGAFIVAIGIFQHKKSLSKLEYLALLSYFVLPVVGMVLLIFIYGVSYLNLALSVSGLIMFVVHMVERSKRMTRQEIMLVQSKTGLLLGQIRPHFICNCMGVIRGLCVEDTEKAIETIDHFSVYLRESFSFMEREQCILFSQEMDLVENYLYMEQQRFPGRIRIVKEFEAENFELPSLTVQPIVENAVRHGIRAKRETGTVTIATKLTDDSYIITVSDNGVGFDPSQKKNDGKDHVGISNVARRLEYMAGGQMKIESTIGQGTKVSIIIPKKKSVV
ncbi:MAG: histidine kinase [Eubacterium sp.]|nr:histidine kinase [Eubacterium sp.]